MFTKDYGLIAVIDRKGQMMQISKVYKYPVSTNFVTAISSHGLRSCLFKINITDVHKAQESYRKIAKNFLL